MNKGMKWLVITLAVPVVLAAGLGATVASAAEPPTTPGPRACCGLGGGFRFGGVVIDEVVTDLLGMTRDEIHALRLEGKSLVQIAAAKNVTENQLVDAIMAYKETQVQARVTARTLTAEQAGLILERMQEMTIQAVNRTTVGPMRGGGAGNGACGGGFGFGFGRMNRWGR